MVLLSCLAFCSMIYWYSFVGCL